MIILRFKPRFLYDIHYIKLVAFRCAMLENIKKVKLPVKTVSDQRIPFYEIRIWIKNGPWQPGTVA